MEELFKAHASTWEDFLKADVEWVGLIEEKLGMLLADSTKEAAYQAVEFLYTIDPSGLIFLLQWKRGEVVLQEQKSIANRQAVKAALVEFVSQSSSIWYPLYQKGCFHKMLFHALQMSKWKNLSEKLKNHILSHSLTMMWIPKGAFVMGAFDRSSQVQKRSQPCFQVELTHNMLVGKYPVTQGLWECVMGYNPSHFQGATRPVENVSWCEAVLFCNRLSVLEGYASVYQLPKDFESILEQSRLYTDRAAMLNACSKKVRLKQGTNGHQLPTEAEWEYCARAGRKTRYAGSDCLKEVGWYSNNSNQQSQAVGQKKSNAFGLHEMSGNVWEWCFDSWTDYGTAPQVDPVFFDHTSHNRTRRGGSWFCGEDNTRVAKRQFGKASYRLKNQGFRFVRVLF